MLEFGIRNDEQVDNIMRQCIRQEALDLIGGHVCHEDNLAVPLTTEEIRAVFKALGEDDEIAEFPLWRIKEERGGVVEETGGVDHTVHHGEGRVLENFRDNTLTTITK